MLPDYTKLHWHQNQNSNNIDFTPSFVSSPSPNDLVIDEGSTTESDTEQTSQEETDNKENVIIITDDSDGSNQNSILSNSIDTSISNKTSHILQQSSTEVSDVNQKRFYYENKQYLPQYDPDSVTCFDPKRPVLLNNTQPYYDINHQKSNELSPMIQIGCRSSPGSYTCTSNRIQFGNYENSNNLFRHSPNSDQNPQISSTVSTEDKKYYDNRNISRIYSDPFIHRSAYEQTLYYKQYGLPQTNDNIPYYEVSEVELPKPSPYNIQVANTLKSQKSILEASNRLLKDQLETYECIQKLPQGITIFPVDGENQWKLEPSKPQVTCKLTLNQAGSSAKNLASEKYSPTLVSDPLITKEKKEAEGIEKHQQRLKRKNKKQAKLNSEGNYQKDKRANKKYKSKSTSRYSSPSGMMYPQLSGSNYPLNYSTGQPMSAFLPWTYQNHMNEGPSGSGYINYNQHHTGTVPEYYQNPFGGYVFNPFAAMFHAYRDFVLGNQYMQPGQGQSCSTSNPSTLNDVNVNTLKTSKPLQEYNHQEYNPSTSFHISDAMSSEKNTKCDN